VSYDIACSQKTNGFFSPVSQKQIAILVAKRSGEPVAPGRAGEILTQCRRLFSVEARFDRRARAALGASAQDEEHITLFTLNRYLDGFRSHYEICIHMHPEQVPRRVFYPVVLGYSFDPSDGRLPWDLHRGISHAELTPDRIAVIFNGATLPNSAKGIHCCTIS
jgi:hypothetical protein